MWKPLIPAQASAIAHAVGVPAGTLQYFSADAQSETSAITRSE
jgi:hypothetical protein